MKNNVDFQIVGNLIYKLRMSSGLNQQELADALKVSKVAVSQWENGVSGIKTEKLYDIAKYFNITVEELINGKLNSEENAEFFRRKYDLKHHADFSDINEKNIDSLLDYLKLCNEVKERLFDLYPKYMEHNLTIIQSDEFNVLLSNFSLNTDYLLFAGLKVFNYTFDDYMKPGFVKTNFTLEDLVNELRNTKKIIDQKDLDFELSKIYSLDIQVDAVKVIEYCEESSDAYLKLLNRQQKDELLTEITNRRMVSQFENSTVVKRLIDSGARVLTIYNYNDVPSNCWSHKEELMCFEGGVVETKDDAEELLETIDNSMGEGSVLWYGTANYWRMVPRNKYDLLVNHWYTDKLWKVIYLKNDKPLEYFNYLLSLVR